LAHLTGFFNRRCHVNPQWSKIRPANLIRLAYSRYKHVRANTIDIVNVHILNTQSGSNGKLVSTYWPKFTALRLFVETMPIYKAVATGNWNNELSRETAHSNWKQPSIATMPDHSRITVAIPTPLIFRYHLPLTVFSTNMTHNESTTYDFKTVKTERATSLEYRIPTVTHME
jgi:hypothetical protein